MKGTAIATLQKREPPLVLEEVQRLIENGTFQLSEFNLAEDVSGLAKMLSLKGFLDGGLASPVIGDFPTPKEIYQHRLAEVEESVKHQTSFLSRVSAALEIGYSPFTVNKTWFCGLLEPEQESVVYDGRVEKVMGAQIIDMRHEIRKVATVLQKRYPLFNQVFPMTIWEKYQTAKNLGIFDVMLVHAPVADDFNYVDKEEIMAVKEITVVRGCPILIGYIRSGEPSHIKFVKGGNQFSFVGGEEKIIPFLVAQWDLGKDLQADKV